MNGRSALRPDVLLCGGFAAAPYPFDRCYHVATGWNEGEFAPTHNSYQCDEYMRADGHKESPDSPVGRGDKHDILAGL